MPGAELHFRPAAPADAEGVAALVNERELVDRGVTEVTAPLVGAHWATPGITLAADGLVGELHDQIVCAALATRDREYVYVAIDQEGRGLGARLLKWVMDRSVARGAVHHLQIIGSANAAAARLLRGAGYERSRSFHRMRLEIDGSPSAELDRCAEIRIRRIDVERDTRELHRLDTAAFAANPDYQPETCEQFRDEHLRAHDADPHALLAATDGDRIVGYLLGARRRGGEVGYVSVLGVHPAARRRGVAHLLLRTAFEAWRTDGIGQAELTVASDNPGARALYERIGMKTAYTLDCYQRPLMVREKVCT